MTMDLNMLRVTPSVGVGDLRFGLNRREVRELMGVPSEITRRSAWSRSLTDRYDDLWLTLDYSDSGELEFIEIGSGRSAVEFGDVRLMPGRAKDIENRLEDLGHVVRRVDSGLSIDGTGIKLYVS